MAERSPNILNTVTVLSIPEVMNGIKMSRTQVYLKPATRIRH